MFGALGESIQRLLRIRWFLPAAIITLFTLGIVGTVVVTTTSAGCTLGLQTTASHCVKTNPVAGVTSSPSPRVSSSPNVTLSPIPAANPGASSYPPYDSASSSYPPYNPGVTAGSPLGSGGSFAFPPLPGAATGSTSPTVALSCRLPIYVGQPGSGGFIVFPGGGFIADPRSAVTAPSPSPGGPSPTPNQYGPGYVGWWGLSYDATYSRWLPVPTSWVSPDGSRYAYQLGGDIYVQNVANGSQVELASGRGFVVLSVDAGGVFATGAPGQAGLWYLPFTGDARQITATGYWQGVSKGFAFGTLTSAVPQGVATTVVRLDTKTGAIKDWYTSQPGTNTNLIGFDAGGSPVLQVSYPSGFALWIASGPFNLTGISWNWSGDGGFPQGPVLADEHGLWVGTNAGIDLYANGHWYLMSPLGTQLAGRCV